ncbi:TetR/AcrR family transcriptional regulator [Azospirillum thermophilum]|nr:TetR/AcrR family transcriptional regulator [Azospirillum thermophilum]
MNTLVAPTPEAGSKPAQILEAAGALFLENGYGAVSMDAVAKRANVSKATLYAHFGSKDELFRAMMARECATLLTASTWEEARSLPIADGLRLVGERFVTFVTSPKALAGHRVILGEAHRFPELSRAFFEAGPAHTIRLFTGIMQEAQRRDELSITDPALAAEQFLALIKANMHMKLLLCVTERPTQEEIRHYVNAAVELFVKGYAPAG